MPRNSLGQWLRFFERDLDEAIRLANDSCFGLGASAGTQDERGAGTLIINELEAGMVFINKMVASDPRSYSEGSSSQGTDGDSWSTGIREFTNIKTVWIQ